MIFYQILKKLASLTDVIKHDVDVLNLDFENYNLNAFEQYINKYIYYYNNEKLAYSLDYKTPAPYRTELSFPSLF